MSEPTEAQVEAAAKEYAWNGSMRAALVAAQGAAPQAECPERPGDRPCEASKPGHKLHWSNGPNEERGNVKLIADARALSEYLSEHIPGSRYKPMIDRLANALEACPVLPSSGVDEDALAKAWDEGALWAAVECGAIVTENAAWIVPGDNPYRAAAYRQERKEG